MGCRRSTASSTSPLTGSIRMNLQSTSSANSNRMPKESWRSPRSRKESHVLLKCSFDNSHVLLRAYGNRSNILIDRERELKNHLLLQEHDLAPTLIAKFQNGLLYPYQPGKALKPTEMPTYYVPIARKLAEWHTLPCADETELWETLLRWIKWLEENGESQAESYRQQVCHLQQELDYAVHVVNGHNDLLSGNIILLDNSTNHDRSIPSKEAHAQVTFVDFEYATAVPRGYVEGTTSPITSMSGVDLPASSGECQIVRSASNGSRHISRHRQATRTFAVWWRKWRHVGVSRICTGMWCSNGIGLIAGEFGRAFKLAYLRLISIMPRIAGDSLRSTMPGERRVPLSSRNQVHDGNEPI